MTIDGYKVIRELTASARSQVYLVMDTKTQSLLVMKTPSVNFDDDAVYLELFLREERVGQQVASPHVAMTILPGQTRAFLYTLMEYIKGQTLRQWMIDNSGPDLQRVRTIVDQIAIGLRALHRKEIIHQDLKPENIMIDEAGCVKLIDLGAVRVLGIEENLQASVPEQPQGALNYAAPEFLKNGKATPSSELYALAAITYEMICGEMPFPQRTRYMKKGVQASYRPLSNDTP
jgi:serine/threonine protein kinase